MDRSLKKLVLIFYLSMVNVDKAICFHYLAGLNTGNNALDQPNVDEQSVQGKK
jgi:hypothetical protein